MGWLSCCFSGDDEGDQRDPPAQTQTQSIPRGRWDAAPPLGPEADEQQAPPPYSVFDPHPEDCRCAIHVSKPQPLRPIVVEAFQSQGCNSCPPTNTLLLSLLTLADPNILVLDYHVTYWDHLGWKDTFGLGSADAYQREYARAAGTSRVYTPQVVVNGIAEGVGNSTKKLEKLIKEGGLLASQGRPWLLFSKVDEGIRIREASSAAVAGAGRRGRVVEVVYDPGLREVRIPRGENAGTVLPHRNVVKSVRVLGVWPGVNGVVRLPPFDPGDQGLERVLIVQEGEEGGGPIIGVARVHF